MGTFLFQDWENNKGNTKGRIIGLIFRLANLAPKKKIYKILLFPYLIFYKVLFEWLMGFEIPYPTRIGKGLKIYHLQSIVINKGAIIGENCQLRHCTTIGNKKAGGGCPIIGDNVNIGANVCIIGEIHIGDNAVIGSGAVVIKDVPSNCTAVGNPARILLNK